MAGSRVESPVAILYDWDSQWAMEDSQGPRNKGLHLLEVQQKFYGAFRRRGLNVDLVDMDCDIEKYRVLALPMCYMFKEGFSEKVRAFVEKGGILINTYWSGIADDTDLCYLGGTPHGLMDVLGARSMEIDGLYDWEENELVPEPGNELGLNRTYRCKYLCDLLELRGAKAVMTYGSDFYQGYPALTVNAYGKGFAWYVAADGEKEFYQDFIRLLMEQYHICGPVSGSIPENLEVTTRETDDSRYVIYQNFGTEPVKLPLPEGAFEAFYGDAEKDLSGYDMVILKQNK